ncbi:RDD family protein [Mollicutes bacterium LVI A0039]|nr:RDD family protein [Mollicutes bacterium LVI A0039]
MSYYWRRIGSYIIDLSVISMISQIIFGFLGTSFKLTGTNIYIDILIIYGFLIFAVLVAVTYNVACYHYFKYPLGKLLMGIKVLNHRQRRVSTRVYAKREFNKYFYMYATLCLYLPYQFIRYVLPHKQTYHERQSNTHIFI